ncbi:hypothetical protein, partial [Lactobacillus kefiranofaciens]|uniref:hypothetical protein n=1 Tax=Lactobacillus kefiranofaciens TaxID=267818 RepID=UPI001F32B45A
ALSSVGTVERGAVNISITLLIGTGFDLPHMKVLRFLFFFSLGTFPSSKNGLKVLCDMSSA